MKRYFFIMKALFFNKIQWTSSLNLFYILKNKDENFFGFNFWKQSAGNMWMTQTCHSSSRKRKRAWDSLSISTRWLLGSLRFLWCLSLLCRNINLTPSQKTETAPTNIYISKSGCKKTTTYAVLRLVKGAYSCLS
jgi:hypothetical protein